MRKLLTSITLSIILISCSESSGKKQKTVDRIVSMAPSITETLFALNLGKKVVAVSSYCDYPAEAGALPKIGGLLDTSIEQIYSVKPDLVIHLPSQQHTADTLQTMGISTFAVSQNSLKEIRQSIQKLGRKLNCLSQAQTLLESLKIKPIKQLSPPPKVLIVISRDTATPGISSAYLASDNTWYGDLVKAAGGENALKHKIPYPSFSKEGIIQLNPDIIIEIMPQAGKPQITIDKIRSTWANALPGLNAVKSNQIYLIKALYAVRPGPRYPLLFEELKKVINSYKN